MITLAHYWMGRDDTYPLAMTPGIERAASLTVELANKLLGRLQLAGVPLLYNARTSSIVSSGWRPPALNAQTAGAAPNSKHMTGQAVDIYDPEGDIDEWLMTPEGQRALVDIGIWIEDPGSTKGWSHWQTIPPRSGRRVFYP